jgi:hypothetical protein
LLINPLLQYKPFADFYGNEVKPLGFTIHYFYNPNLIPNTANTSADGKTHTAIVELGNISPNQDWNFVIAHELAVIVAANYGLRTSMITLQPQDSSCADLVGNMQDMMSTPFRDGILASYGFDVEREFYAHRIPPLFSLACAEGNNLLENLGDACQYVKLVLYWQIVLQKPGNPPIIEKWWHDCRPTVWALGQDILAMIPTERLISTQDITTLFSNIIKKYELQDCVSLP